MVPLTTVGAVDGGRQEERPPGGGGGVVPHHRTSAGVAGAAVAGLVGGPVGAGVRRELAGVAGVDGLDEQLVGPAVAASDALVLAA